MAIWKTSGDKTFRYVCGLSSLPIMLGFWPSSLAAFVYTLQYTRMYVQYVGIYQRVSMAPKHSPCSVHVDIKWNDIFDFCASHTAHHHQSSREFHITRPIYPLCIHTHAADNHKDVTRISTVRQDRMELWNLQPRTPKINLAPFVFFSSQIVIYISTVLTFLWEAMWKNRKLGQRPPPMAIMSNNWKAPKACRRWKWTRNLFLDTLAKFIPCENFELEISWKIWMWSYKINIW